VVLIVESEVVEPGNIGEVDVDVLIGEIDVDVLIGEVDVDVLELVVSLIKQLRSGSTVIAFFS
jgi:hypothetical protein